MYCEDCDFSVSNYICECRIFTMKKIYCTHIQLLLIPKNKENSSIDEAISEIRKEQNNSSLINIK